MKIDYTYDTGLEEISRAHDLTLQIVERPHSARERGLKRFWAAFQSVEIKEGAMLVGAFGDGDTMEEAVADYCRKIQGKDLVFEAYSKLTRKEFKAPSEISPPTQL